MFHTGASPMCSYTPRPPEGGATVGVIFHIPSFRSHPSLSGLKKVCVRSFPSSSGILKGSFLMLSNKFYTKGQKSSNQPFCCFRFSACTRTRTHAHTRVTESASARLTLRSSSGRSPPSLMPLFMAVNLCTEGLSFTLGLCRLVFNMITAKDNT